MKIKSWQEALEAIDYMLPHKEYKYAEETLKGIAETIRRKQKMTPGQERAIRNILRGARA